MIILIGNARPTQQLGQLIHLGGEIVRFNHCHFLDSGWTGSRTDVYVIQNMDEHFRTRPLRELGARKIVVIAESPVRDFTSQIRGMNPHLEDREWLTVYSDDLNLRPRVQSHGASSGFIMVEHYLRVMNVRQIAITGFTWEGWDGHPWAAEKRECLKYQAEGRLIILP